MVRSGIWDKVVLSGVTWGQFGSNRVMQRRVPSSKKMCKNGWGLESIGFENDDVGKGWVVLNEVCRY